ncbi:MAG: peptide-methionine (S)-S-oxide reductase [Alphaproteobacteria bacterium HGW-Alphaproteobacteria-3]|nr:MAG: peptide-methionine (S)-S-oxide reductase [Alphaproteobacteria bacterium HGW-Alphaproteobacteria-3]
MRFLFPLALALAMLAGGATAQPAPEKTPGVAIFAGGCFWCMEPPFDKTEGVIGTTSGYTGGTAANPGYEEVARGGTGHAEAVKVVYDPAKVSYEELLHIFWRNIDPFRKDAQFCDAGSQYRSAIFTLDAEQKRLAEKSKEELEKSGRFSRPLVTEIVEAGPFFPAEKYHQDYYMKNPNRYAYYRWSCGRDARLEQVWGSEAGGH